MRARALFAATLVLTSFVACSNSYSLVTPASQSSDAAAPDSALDAGVPDAPSDSGVAPPACSAPSAVVCDSFDGPLNPLWTAYTNPTTGQPDPAATIANGELVASLPANGQNDGQELQMIIPTDAPVRVSFDLQLTNVDAGNMQQNFALCSLQPDPPNGELVSVYGAAFGSMNPVVMLLVGKDQQEQQLGPQEFSYNTSVHVEFRVTWGTSGSAQFFVNGAQVGSAVAFSSSVVADPRLILGLGRPDGPTAALSIRYDNFLVQTL